MSEIIRLHEESGDRLEEPILHDMKGIRQKLRGELENSGNMD
jgi:hypothetical protein